MVLMGLELQKKSKRIYNCEACVKTQAFLIKKQPLMDCLKVCLAFVCGGFDIVMGKYIEV